MEEYSNYFIMYAVLCALIVFPVYFKYFYNEFRSIDAGISIWFFSVFFSIVSGWLMVPVATMFYPSYKVAMILVKKDSK